MNLQTQIPLKKQTYNLVDYNSKLLLIGSCFTKNIGHKFSYYKFKSLQNPFGILFHPKAIETLITNAINQKKYTNEDLFFDNERWHCFETHSLLSSSDKNKLLYNLNSATESTFYRIQDASHIILTLGTAWVYRELTSGKIVANCHKVPQKKFVKEILSIDEITESLKVITNLIQSINKNVKVLLTVSPVRHLKDGFINNNRSKSHLISAIHNILNQNQDFVFYLPSYEIMMDELRDYRFYTEDMIHPNQTAINYIWQKFVDVWVSDKAITIMQDVETIQKGLAHKPFNSSSKQHQQFLKNLTKKKEMLLTAFPYIEFK